MNRVFTTWVAYALAVPAILSFAGCESTSQQSRGTATSSTTAKKTTATNEATVPIVKEELQVGKREVQEGTTRVKKHVVEKPVEKNMTLRDEEVRVERREANRPVKDADKAFQEQTIEMTETKEVPMVSKNARVTGEVALKKETEQRKETVRDTVRSTEVEVIDGGQGQASIADWSTYESDFRKNYQSTYANTGLEYEQVKPAYRHGYELAKTGRGSDWSSVEPQAKRSWEQEHKGAWDQYRDAVRYGWERAQRGKG
jgi:uncharacterized protein (TIGR02271 family)